MYLVREMGRESNLDDKKDLQSFASFEAQR